MLCRVCGPPEVKPRYVGHQQRSITLGDKLTRVDNGPFTDRLLIPYANISSEPCIIMLLLMCQQTINSDIFCSCM